MSQEKKELMNRALSAMTINIGKAAVNDNVIEEIKRQLKANEIVKLKFAKNVAKIAEGHVIIFHKRFCINWYCLIKILCSGSGFSLASV